ncbi:MAG: hypothetical protein IKU57_03580 [Oscillospiraceae bacterium]|nr:hypothetical protein [Oscillospiraceae bacterium]
MAKGAYQVGALKALEEFIPREEIKYISCASVGVLNGYAYATGNLAAAEEMWKKLCDGRNSRSIRNVLLSMDLQKCIAKLYKAEKPIEAEDFYCSLLRYQDNVLDMKSVHKNLAKVEQEKLLPYLRASVALSMVNKPIPIKEGEKTFFYYDGAPVDNVPVYPFVEKDLDYVICMYFDDASRGLENREFDNKVIKVSFPNSGGLRKSTIFDKWSILQMIEEGYEYTNHLLKSVFSQGYENLEEIYKTVEYMNRNRSTDWRNTGDVLVSGLNKVTRKLTKKEIHE